MGTYLRGYYPRVFGGGDEVAPAKSELADYVAKYYEEEKQAEDEIAFVAAGDVALAQQLRGWRIEDFYATLVRRMEEAERREAAQRAAQSQV